MTGTLGLLLYLALLAVFGHSGRAASPDSWPFVFDKDGQGGYQLVAPGVVPDIRVASDDLPGVIRAASDLAADFGRVTGTNATVIQSNWQATSSSNSSKPVIIVGTAGRSNLIRGLESSGRFNTSAVVGKWETFSYEVLSKPWQGQDNVFVIAGSDLRGTVFGIYDVSERIGVSPWYWWADIPSVKREYISVKNPASIQGPPSVKFRGIFFNDESPCLTGWGREKFGTSQYGSPFMTAFYSRVFELLLRMKANYMWPAMWSSMFYLDDKNGPLADMYGVFIGTSHEEPLTRADKEISRFLKGSWDWKSNKANVQAFMQEGVTRSKNWSTVYSLGMRGQGDTASPTLTSPALEDVIHWQQSALKQTLGKDLSDIPQAWVMYKEVPGYWQNGMNVSDDVTLIWTDDNRGNIRRIPIANETTRRGGSGMYYHFDYVGSPRNYKWINSIQFQKTWEQMSLAYYRGIQNLWVVNIGDLKGLELPTSHLLAMAWNMDDFRKPTSTYGWLKDWSGRQFGNDVGDKAASIMTTYGKLTARRKYEDLSMTPFAFSTISYDEAESNYAEWTSLLDRAQAIYDALPAETQDAFFELVLHPVLAGKTVYEIYTKTAMASKYSNEHRVSANKISNEAKAAFSTDSAITKRYHSLLDGKWDHMMDQVHIGYTNWQDPAANTMPRLSYTASSTASKNAIMGVSVQGSSSFYPTTSALSLSPMNPYIASGAELWLEVFARDNGTFSFTIASNVSFVNTTIAQGTVTAPGNVTDIRSLINVDWDAAPSGSSVAGLTVTSSTGGASAHISVPISKVTVPDGFQGHVEADGVVSIEAEHFGAGSGSEYEIIPDYGRTLSGVKFEPDTASQAATKGPVLIYPFYTFSNATSASLTVYLSSSENSNPTSPNRYSFSIDGTTATTVQPVPLANAGSEPNGWDNAVIANAWVKSTGFGKLAAGKHELRVWLLEPTMVLTKLVIDLGGLKSSALGPPESKRIGV